MTAPLDPCDWLRAVLTARLEEVRAAAPRSEVDALLGGRPVGASAPPPRTPTLLKLAARLDLRSDEQDVLAVLFAASMEPALGRALGLLFDPLGRGMPTWEAVLAVLGRPAADRLIPEDGLCRWGLVVRNAGGIALDPLIESRLAGRPSRDTALVGSVVPIPVHPPLPGWPVAETAAAIRRAIAAGARGVRLWVRGPQGSGRRTFFAAVARELELVGVTAGPLDSQAVRAMVRLAWLDDLAPAWIAPLELPGDLAVPPLQGWLGAEAPPHPPIALVDLTVRLPTPDGTARRAAWDGLVPAFRGWPAAEQEALVAAWAGRPGQLAPLGWAGVDAPEEARATLRSDAAQRLEGYCDVLETPFGWDDLVLPGALHESLRELAYEMRALPALWTEPEVARLFPQGRSVAAMFSGPPGTGKTMAAQVVAREIGLPLFRVDLSRMVSKYVGETSQNLARLLGAARDTDAVVFFDEADALFGRRTDVQDAHDRYANTDTDYLLQALDSWPGAVLLATNRKGNIDPAFLRRMRMVLEFPRPDAHERLRIWQRLVAALAPDLLPQLEVSAVAETIELTGAQIKGAVLTARLMAGRLGRPVGSEHLVRGIERELEKDGRGLSARDRKRLVGR